MQANAKVYTHQNGMEICHFLELNPHFPPHFHDHWLIGALISGRRQLTCDTFACLMVAGDIAIIKPFQIHGCFSTDNDAAEWICLRFPGGIGQTGPQTGIHRDKAQLLAFQRAADRAMSGEWEPISQLAGNIIRQCGQENSAYSPFEGVCRFLWENVERSISLDEMASVAKMGKFHFARKFAAKYGLPPHRYLENLRLNKAAEMLRAGASIAHAACAAGFYDQAHLHKRFQASQGYTPGQYRRAWWS